MMRRVSSDLHSVPLRIYEFPIDYSYHGSEETLRSIG